MAARPGPVDADDVQVVGGTRLGDLALAALNDG